MRNSAVRPQQTLDTHVVRTQRTTRQHMLSYPLALDKHAFTTRRRYVTRSYLRAQTHVDTFCFLYFFFIPSPPCCFRNVRLATVHGRCSFESTRCLWGRRILNISQRRRCARARDRARPTTRATDRYVNITAVIYFLFFFAIRRDETISVVYCLFYTGERNIRVYT